MLPSVANLPFRRIGDAEAASRRTISVPCFVPACGFCVWACARVRTCVYVCVHAHVRVCAHVCACACVCACVHMCACARVCACSHFSHVQIVATHNTQVLVCVQSFRSHPSFSNKRRPTWMSESKVCEREMVDEGVKRERERVVPPLRLRPYLLFPTRPDPPLNTSI